MTKVNNNTSSSHPIGTKELSSKEFKEQIKELSKPHVYLWGSLLPKIFQRITKDSEKTELETLLTDVKNLKEEILGSKGALFLSENMDNRLVLEKSLCVINQIELYLNIVIKFKDLMEDKEKNEKEILGIYLKLKEALQETFEISQGLRESYSPSLSGYGLAAVSASSTMRRFCSTKETLGVATFVAAGNGIPLFPDESQGLENLFSENGINANQSVTPDGVSVLSQTENALQMSVDAVMIAASFHAMIFSDSSISYTLELQKKLVDHIESLVPDKNAVNVFTMDKGIEFVQGLKSKNITTCEGLQKEISSFLQEKDEGYQNVFFKFLETYSYKSRNFYQKKGAAYWGTVKDHLFYHLTKMEKAKVRNLIIGKISDSNQETQLDGTTNYYVQRLFCSSVLDNDEKPSNLIVKDVLRKIQASNWKDRKQGTSLFSGLLWGVVASKKLSSNEKKFLLEHIKTELDAKNYGAFAGAYKGSFSFASSAIVSSGFSIKTVLKFIASFFVKSDSPTFLLTSTIGQCFSASTFGLLSFFPYINLFGPSVNHKSKDKNYHLLSEMILNSSSTNENSNSSAFEDIYPSQENFSETNPLNQNKNQMINPAETNVQENNIEPNGIYEIKAKLVTNVKRLQDPSSKDQAFQDILACANHLAKLNLAREVFESNYDAKLTSSYFGIFGKALNYLLFDILSSLDLDKKNKLLKIIYHFEDSEIPKNIDDFEAWLKNNFDNTSSKAASIATLKSFALLEAFPEDEKSQGLKNSCKKLLYAYLYRSSYSRASLFKILQRRNEKTYTGIKMMLRVLATLVTTVAYSLSPYILVALKLSAVVVMFGVGTLMLSNPYMITAIVLLFIFVLAFDYTLRKMGESAEYTKNHRYYQLIRGMMDEDKKYFSDNSDNSKKEKIFCKDPLNRKKGLNESKFDEDLRLKNLSEIYGKYVLEEKKEIDKQYSNKVDKNSLLEYMKNISKNTMDKEEGLLALIRALGVLMQASSLSKQDRKEVLSRFFYHLMNSDKNLLKILRTNSHFLRAARFGLIDFAAGSLLGAVSANILPTAFHELGNDSVFGNPLDGVETNAQIATLASGNFLLAFVAVQLWIKTADVSKQGDSKAFRVAIRLFQKCIDNLNSLPEKSLEGNSLPEKSLEGNSLPENSLEGNSLPENSLEGKVENSPEDWDKICDNILKLDTRRSYFGFLSSYLNRILKHDL